MNTPRHALLLPASILVTALAGCSWVTLSPGGERVRLMKPEEVTVCQKLGRTTATTSTTVLGFIGRSYPTVAEEVQQLGRNEAAKMGGDSIAPEGGIEGGRQTFGVYRCIGSVERSGGSGSAVTRPLPQ
ncbi:MAG: DUF4156 domain-containing protein [Gammaproteobacteria bacterium]|nr:DUF4156 domain-containing protein [Gammaproteobacteria bacterium]